MKIQYDRESDVLMFILQDGFPENALSEPGGVIISYNEANEPLTIEFLNASKRQWFNGYENSPITIALAWSAQKFVCVVIPPANQLRATTQNPLKWVKNG